MKRYIPVFALAALVACSNNKPSETETRTIQSTQPATPATDTTGLAQFQQWKAQNELATANEAEQAQKPAVIHDTVRTVTVVREARSPQRSTVRKPTRQTSTSTSNTPAKTAQEPSTTTAGTSSTGTTGSGSGSASGSSSGTASTGTASAPAPAPAEEKKGMSKTAKGAVIGGAGGAVLGAIINKKNRAAGAVIGGVLGAGVGYGIGKKKQKADTTGH